MSRNKIVLITLSLFLFTGCAERGFPMPSVLDSNATTYSVPLSKKQTEPKSVDRVHSEVINIPNANTTSRSIEQKPFISDSLKNKITGALILLIGIAMVI